MHREILFKAKRADTGEWIEGLPSYCSSDGTMTKLESYSTDRFEMATIDPDTICQYTGLTDKNGQKIWENDIVKHHSGEKYAPVKYGMYHGSFDSQTVSHDGFFIDWEDGVCLRKDLGYWMDMVRTEIVGNIFDKPELLKKKSEKKMKNRTLEEIQEDIRTLTSVPLEIINAKLNELAEEVGELVNSQWIPCSERLPEKQTDVLVTVKYNGFMGMHGTWIKKGHFHEYGWDGDCCCGTVVAWMPLPEPYKGE